MTSKNYNQHTAVSALLRGETIPAEWMDKLAKVKSLYLSNNQIVDPSGLAALTRLKWLYLGDNQIVDPSAIAALREALPGTKIIA